MYIRWLKFPQVLALILFCGLAVFAQEIDTTPSLAGATEIYLAKDDGNGKAGEEATSFVTTDVPIYCVVMLSTATPVKVRMNLVAVAVAGVRPDTKIVSTTYATRESENRVNFSGRPAGQWVPGRYRVDIFVDEKPIVSREFAVQKATQAAPAPKPQSPKVSDKSRLAGPVKKS